jgi:hypothetical protein
VFHDKFSSNLPKFLYGFDGFSVNTDPSAVECCMWVLFHFFIRSFLTSVIAPVLAVQNMEATGSVAKEAEVEFEALMGSLTMMSKGS